MSNDIPTPTADARLNEAVRRGCTAANVHLACAFPDCACIQIPVAVKVAVAYAQTVEGLGL